MPLNTNEVFRVYSTVLGVVNILKDRWVRGSMDMPCLDGLKDAAICRIGRWVGFAPVKGSRKENDLHVS